MFRRGISEENVRHVLAQGEEIEGYSEDAPYPSRLVLGWRGSRPIHVVAAEDVEGERPFVITVYEPSLDHWEPDFKRRRNS
jgi:hypothetical protein